MAGFDAGSDEADWLAFVEAWAKVQSTRIGWSSRELVVLCDEQGLLRGVIGDGSEHAKVVRLTRALGGVVRRPIGAFEIRESKHKSTRVMTFALRSCAPSVHEQRQVSWQRSECLRFLPRGLVDELAPVSDPVACQQLYAALRFSILGARDFLPLVELALHEEELRRAATRQRGVHAHDERRSVRRQRGAR